MRGCLFLLVFSCFYCSHSEGLIYPSSVAALRAHHWRTGATSVRSATATAATATAIAPEAAPAKPAATETEADEPHPAAAAATGQERSTASISQRTSEPPVVGESPRDVTDVPVLEIEVSDSLLAASAQKGESAGDAALAEKDKEGDEAAAAAAEEEEQGGEEEEEEQVDAAAADEVLAVNDTATMPPPSKTSPAVLRPKKAFVTWLERLISKTGFTLSMATSILLLNVPWLALLCMLLSYIFYPPLSRTVFFLVGRATRRRFALPEGFLNRTLVPFISILSGTVTSLTINQCYTRQQQIRAMIQNEISTIDMLAKFIDVELRNDPERRIFALAEVDRYARGLFRENAWPVRIKRLSWKAITGSHHMPMSYARPRVAHSSGSARGQAPPPLLSLPFPLQSTAAGSPSGRFDAAHHATSPPSAPNKHLTDLVLPRPSPAPRNFMTLLFPFLAARDGTGGRPDVDANATYVAGSGIDFNRYKVLYDLPAVQQTDDYALYNVVDVMESTKAMGFIKELRTLRGTRQSLTEQGFPPLHYFFLTWLMTCMVFTFLYEAALAGPSAAAITRPTFVALMGGITWIAELVVELSDPFSGLYNQNVLVGANKTLSLLQALLRRKPPREAEEQ